MDIIGGSSGIVMLPDKDMDQVYPRLYLGEAASARSRFKLTHAGITHVLNTAEGPGQYHVQISPEIYENLGIQWMAVEATDDKTFPIETLFNKTSNFIEEGLSQEGGILVHCCAGFSRSASVVIAFLMQHRHVTVQDALRQVNDRRNICPNEGFLQKLCDLNDKLTESGHFETIPSSKYGKQ